MSDRVISIDAESNGLGGEAFCVALTLSDDTGELDQVVYRCPVGEIIVSPWVVENVIPVIADVPETHRMHPFMLADLGKKISEWGGKNTRMIGHVVWPVEARLLLAVYSGEGVWDGPYPLVDVSSVLLAKGHDPLSVDDYLAANGLPAPEGSPHHPLYDARAAERCYRHLMASGGIR